MMSNDERHRRRRSRSPNSRDHREYARQGVKNERTDRTRSRDDNRSRNTDQQSRYRDDRDYRTDEFHPYHRDRERESYTRDRQHDRVRDRDEDMRQDRDRNRRGRDTQTRRENRKQVGRGQEVRSRPINSGDQHHPADALLQDYGDGSDENSEGNEPPKEGPDFKLSGKLTEYTNTYKGVVIKYNEPPEARKPKKRWRLYPFKGEQAMSVLYIHRQSAYLLGRQRHIADIPIDHPSCSKQHAVLQYRLVDHEKTDSTLVKRVKPYIIDLESANGTYLNNQRIDPRRYYELQEKDVLKFGFSSREYVILHEKSDTAAMGEEEFSPSSGEGSPGTSK